MPSINTNLVQKLFIKYCKINTRSNPDSSTTPTTPGQVKLAHVIIDDLKQMGVTNVRYNHANGYFGHS